MKKVILKEQVTFWPERVSPYKVTMNAGEEVFIFSEISNPHRRGEVMISLSESPTQGDSRWIKEEMICQ